MIELKDGFVLYHGSYCEVKEPDLAKCAKRKDFGQGFYFNHIKGAGRKFSENLNSQSYRNWNRNKATAIPLVFEICLTKRQS